MATFNRTSKNIAFLQMCNTAMTSTSLTLAASHVGLVPLASFLNVSFLILLKLLSGFL